VSALIAADVARCFGWRPPAKVSMMKHACAAAGRGREHARLVAGVSGMSGCSEQVGTACWTRCCTDHAASEAKGYIARGGQMVDATIVQFPNSA
jgi:hypothetical protein